MSTSTESRSVDSLERLATMSAEEVNDLPYGFLILDREGRVRLYNRYESEMSRLAAEDVIGRNWFRDIAPCTRVEAFQGRFRRLVDDPTVLDESFSFRFHFLHGAQDVTVQMTRAPDASGSVFMTVVRKNVEGLDVDRPNVVVLDEERGVVVGPAGVVLPVPAAAMASMLRHVPLDEVRALGESVGRSLAVSAKREATKLDEPELAGASLLLRAGVLDASVANAGFGRLALDLTAQATTGAIGVTVRSPIPTVTAGLATFYEGLLAAALGPSSRTPLVARCLDVPDAATVPWLFAVVPAAQASRLADAGRVPASVVLKGLGLSSVDEP